MHERMRDRAIEQHRQLSRLERRVGKTGLAHRRFEPFLDTLLVGRGEPADHMLRIAGEFGGAAHQRATFPARIGRLARHRREHRADLVGNVVASRVHGLFQRSEDRRLAQFQIGDDQRVLGREIIVERRLGDAGPLDDGIDADVADPLPIEEVLRHRQNPVAG